MLVCDFYNSLLKPLSCLSTTHTCLHFSTMAIDYVSFAYAATIASGGLMGYVKAGSTASLGAGLLFGSIMCYGAYQTSQNPNNYLLSLGASSLLMGVMGNRFLFQSAKFMPAGLVATLSLAMVLRFGARGLGIVKQ